MQLSELNNLLKPYGVIFECDSCEEVTVQIPRPFGNRTNIQTKKIQKKSPKVVQNARLDQKRPCPPQKCRTAKKDIKTTFSFFDDSLICRSAPAAKGPMAFAPKNVDFFFEFKQSCDNFLNCPRFDNVATCDDLKNANFDYEATMPSLKLSYGNQVVSYQELTSLKKDLFNRSALNPGYDNIVQENNLSVPYENNEDFELDFGQDPVFSEFFNVA